MMLRPLTKVLLVGEVFVGFAPVAVMLLLGIFMAPMQVAFAVKDPLNWRAALMVVSQAFCGVVGIITLTIVLAKLFGGHASIRRKTLACIGIALGIAPLVQIIFQTMPDWPLGILLPLAVCAHVVFLARRMLFSSRGDALGKIAIATAVAIAASAVPLLDPSRASANSLREQQALWNRRAPDGYELTVQLSGYPYEAAKGTEHLMPKRIRVESGELRSATYAWNMGDGFNAGDPARSDNAWTIDRTFAELLAARERGWDVNVRINERWGFVEEARASARGRSNNGWSVRASDFRPLAPPGEIHSVQ